MRQIYQDTSLFHSFEKLSPFRSQSTFGDAVSRTAHLIIEKMCDADHSKAGIIESIEVFHFTAERMRTLNSQKPGHNSRLIFPALEKIRQVSFRFENGEFAIRIFGRFMQPPCLVQCAFSQIKPARNRPALC